MNNLLLYVIYHDDSSFKICYDLLCNYPWIRFEKIKTTKYCESIFFEYLLEHYDEWRTYSFVGMITYSFSSKITLSTLLDAYKNIIEGNFKDYDIIGLRKLNFGIGDQSQIGISKHIINVIKNVAHPNNTFTNDCLPIIDPNQLSNVDSISPISSREMIYKSQSTYANRRLHMLANWKRNLTHKNKETIPLRSCENKSKNVSLDISDLDKIIPFYSNYWLVKPPILKSFLEWTKMVKNAIEKDSVINEENSHYKLDSPQYIPIFGQPWMTWHPFIMERLICIYAYLTNARLHTYDTPIKAKNNKKQFGTVLKC